MSHSFQGEKSLYNKKVLFRFLKCLSPNKGSIIFAMICSLIASIIYLGPIQILADTLDSLKLLEGFSQTAGSIPLRIFHIDNIFDGIEITLEDVEDAYRFFFYLLAAFLCLVFIKGFFDYGSDFLMERVGNKVSFRLRNDLYEKLISAPLGSLSEHHSGDVMTRVTDDVRLLQQGVAAYTHIVRSIIQVVVFGIMLFYKNYLMTILSMLVLPLVAILISQIGSRIRKASKEIQERHSDIYTQLKETLTGINIIKSFTAEKNEIDRFNSITSSQYNSAIRRARFAALLPPIIDWMAAIGTTIVLGLGCWNVIIGKLTIGWFAGYIVLVALMYKPIKTIGSVNVVLQQSLASAERTFYLLDIKREFGTESDGKCVLQNVRGTVQFENVCFAYHEKQVIKNVSFSVEPGEIIALVGPSGGGKTTLLNLLQRFYTVDSGKILIDDIEVSKIFMTSLRKNIALVPQDTFLFDGTVLENIKYGTPTATKEAVIIAAKKANAHGFVSELANGYDTPIGEAGGNLSGGEKQRISIARAILKDAPILILDEATSSLDTQSETIIQNSLTNLMEGRTSFIIAHRLSTVMRADNILVIDDGEIVENGNHTKLVEKGGLYHKLCQQQILG